MNFRPSCAALLLVSAAAAAQQFDTVQVDSNSCSLVRSGTGNEDVVYPGKAQIGMCFVTLPTATFGQTYSYCALSGILSSKGRVGCEFGYFDKKHEQIAFIADRDNVCEYVPEKVGAPRRAVACSPQTPRP